MNYHVNFCETGQGAAAAARSNVTLKRWMLQHQQESCHDDTSHRAICGYASQRRCNAKQFGQTNKANNANGGLKWIQPGGYSECVKRLKGQA